MFYKSQSTILVSTEARAAHSLFSGANRPIGNSAGISLSNTNLTLSGINGQSATPYYTFMSTNLARPLSEWTSVATNFLSTGGAFTITATNAANPNAPQAFYVLQAQ